MCNQSSIYLLTAMMDFRVLVCLCCLTNRQTARAQRCSATLSSCQVLHYQHTNPTHHSSSTHHGRCSIVSQSEWKPATSLADSGSWGGLETYAARTDGLLQESRPKESRRLVCDFSSNNFSLQHLEIVARWLQQPTTGVEIYALDLSFNRILCPSWEEFVPLVKQLSVHVRHMDFGGNYLPPLLESDASLRSLQSLVSLSVPYHSQCGDPWVDYWTERSRQFKELAYGSFQTVW